MSKFLRVKCECGNEQNIFGNATSEVNCLVCGSLIAKPTGARVRIVGGKIVKVM
ncbi:30S ribosomal protein S27e [Candidatus Parvarchaeota archaeon]|nr:30S ribosomal protein S27e [Candidatus Parvarchaeota archaeon]